MSVINIIDDEGHIKRKPMRNCDRCANIQDAKGKFRAEVDQQNDRGGFWRSLCEWLMQEV